jgi:branched-chain amino acid transport system permease protein
LSQFLQQIVNGIAWGSLYALIALGYTMVYGVLRLINFAHGDVYMIGAFIGYFAYSAFGAPFSPSVPVAVLLPTILLAAVVGCGLLGVAIERFAYRPLRSAPRIAP